MLKKALRRKSALRSTSAPCGAPIAAALCRALCTFPDRILDGEENGRSAPNTQKFSKRSKDRRVVQETLPPAVAGEHPGSTLGMSRQRAEWLEDPQRSACGRGSPRVASGAAGAEPHVVFEHKQSASCYERLTMFTSKLSERRVPRGWPWRIATRHGEGGSAPNNTGKKPSGQKMAVFSSRQACPRRVCRVSRLLTAFVFAIATRSTSCG